MYFADYHMHSKYSFDGAEELEAMCREAVKKGLNEIAVTDHMDIYEGLDYGQMKNFDVDQDLPPFGPDGRPSYDFPGGQLVEIPGGSMVMPGGVLCKMDVSGLYTQLYALTARWAGRLKVRVGSELGQPMRNKAAADKFLADWPLDFVIGSIHNMDHDLDVYYYDFTKLDPARVYSAYLDRLLELAREGDFDVLGHITYPVRYMEKGIGRQLALTPFTDRFRDLFGILEYAGRGIELNVSGLCRGIGSTMPPLPILKLYRECHGEIITVGSDAHELAHIGGYQQEAQDMLLEAGFRYITTFEKRKADFVKIS